MNLNKISIIIQREYLNKVKKKSFLITTFLVPILFAALCILPTVIMVSTKEEAKKIAVVDKSGIVMEKLTDTETATYVNCSEMVVDSIKTRLDNLGYDAVLSVSEINPESKSVTAEIFSNKPLGIDLTGTINSRIERAVEDYRIASYEIDGLDQIMKDVKASVNLKSYTMDAEGKETISESGVYMAISMLLGMVIYMFVVMFGAMVMSSVIEEKNSRVVEVLVSSVKATELMFGKIIGIALVALTQFLLWVVLSASIIGVVFGIVGKDMLGDTDPTEMVSTMSGMSADQVEAITAAATNAADQGEIGVVMSTLKNLPVTEILVSFVIFFIFGYMLYASLYAAIGSAVENEGDSQQLQLPVTIPILIAFFIALYAYKAPDSGIVFWASMIPFTSPIVMLARIPFGVPMWQLILSLVLLVVTTGFCAYISAKIYKIGILMFGKKTTWKDLWKWLRMK